METLLCYLGGFGQGSQTAANGSLPVAAGLYEYWDLATYMHVSVGALSAVFEDRIPAKSQIVAETWHMA